MIPQSIQVLLQKDHQIVIENVKRVSGGDINQSYKLSTNRGEFFLKLNSSVPADFFEKEADGLNELYPLLVNANLFGGHYLSQVEHQLKRF